MTRLAKAQRAHSIQDAAVTGVAVVAEEKKQQDHAEAEAEAAYTRRSLTTAATQRVPLGIDDGGREEKERQVTTAVPLVRCGFRRRRRRRLVGR